MIDWAKLAVYNDYGAEIGTLGGLVADAYPGLAGIALDADGRIDQWEQHMIAKPGEEPNYNTPRNPVNWCGFLDALEA